MHAQKEAFEISRQILKLTKDSPQRNSKFKSVGVNERNVHSRIHTFCSTKSTISGETMHSILSKLKELIKDGNMKTRTHDIYT